MSMMFERPVNPALFEQYVLYLRSMQWMEGKHVTPENARPLPRHCDLLVIDDLKDTSTSKEEQARVGALVEAAVSYRSSAIQREAGLLSEKEFAWRHRRFHEGRRGVPKGHRGRDPPGAGRYPCRPQGRGTHYPLTDGRSGVMDHMRAFFKLADSLGPEHDRSRAVRLYLEAAFCALRRDEDGYEAVMKQFRKPGEAKEVLGKMLGVTALALHHDPGRDFLGQVIMEAAQNRHAGQFFTPTDLCRVVAALTMADHVAPKDGILRVDEPASGAGGMVLAKAEMLVQRGVDLADTVFRLADIDAKCVHAAFIQTTQCGIPAVVYHGNSLTTETWGVYPNLPYVRHASHRLWRRLMTLTGQHGRVSGSCDGMDNDCNEPEQLHLPLGLQSPGP